MVARPVHIHRFLEARCHSKCEDGMYLNELGFDDRQEGDDGPQLGILNHLASMLKCLENCRLHMTKSSVSYLHHVNALEHRIREWPRHT